MFDIYYCIFCGETIEKQLNDNGYTLGSKAIHFENKRNAIHELGCYLTDIQEENLFKKLHKDVNKFAKKIDK